MREDGFRPIIDSGSSRVFDCNAISLRLLTEGASGDGLFFRHPRLNHVVIIKHSVLPSERRSRREPPVGTKLFFPFNETNPVEGGSTIFLHDRQLEAALNERCGVNRLVDKEAFEEDLRLLRLLARLPTLDPFLLRDVLEAEGIEANDRYLEISDEQWTEIQGLIQQRFVPIVRAAFPEAKASRAKAKRLIEKLWEAKDEEALAPIIRTFRLPEDGALDILYSWKVITFYAYQYRRLKPTLLELAQWLKESEAIATFAAGPLRAVMGRLHHAVRTELRMQWSKIEVDPRRLRGRLRQDVHPQDRDRAVPHLPPQLPCDLLGDRRRARQDRPGGVVLGPHHPALSAAPRPSDRCAREHLRHARGDPRRRHGGRDHRGALRGV